MQAACSAIMYRVRATGKVILNEPGCVYAYFKGRLGTWFFIRNIYKKEYLLAYHDNIKEKNKEYILEYSTFGGRMTEYSTYACILGDPLARKLLSTCDAYYIVSATVLIILPDPL